MTVYSALAPVSAAIYTALNVSALTTLAPGGVHDDVPQAPTWPFVVFTVSERFTGGLGTRPGVGGAYEIALRLHVYSQARGWKEAQGILAEAVALLATPPAVTGFSSWAIFHDEALPIGESIIAGIKCKELAQNARLLVEAA